MIINLVAGGIRVSEISGRFFTVITNSTFQAIRFRVMRGSDVLDDFTTDRRFAIKYEKSFTRIEFRSVGSGALDFHVSDAVVDVDFADRTTVSAQIINPSIPVTAAAPLAVVPDRGAPGNPMYVSGITYSDAPATAFDEPAPVAVNDTLDLLCAANAARRSVRFRNLGPDPVAIGGAGLTWAKRVVVLDVDDVFIETRGANLAMYAITDTGRSASVTVQGVIS